MALRTSIGLSGLATALSLSLVFPAPARAETKGRDIVMFTGGVVSVSFLGVLIYKAIVSEPSKPKGPPAEPTPVPAAVESKARPDSSPSDPSTEAPISKQIEPTHSKDLLNQP